MIFYLLLLMLPQLLVGEDYLKNAEFYDAFFVYNEGNTSLEGESLENAALSAFYVRRYDIAAKHFGLISKKTRIEKDFEPLFIESLLRIGDKQNALIEAKELTEHPLEIRLKSALPFAFFGHYKTADDLVLGLDAKRLPLQSLNDYVRLLIYRFDYETAKKLIKEKEYFFNSNPQGLLTIALLLLRESKQNEAMASAERAAALSPFDPQILSFLETHEGRSSVLENRLGLLKDRLELPSYSLKMMYLRTLVNLVMLQTTNQDLTEKMLIKATELIDGIKAKMQMFPEFLVLRGIVLWQKKNYEEGMKAAREALMLDKSYGLASQILAAINLIEKLLENAVLVLDEGAPYNIQDSSYFRQLSSVYLALLNYGEAEKKIDHALKINPYNPTLLSMKAEALLGLGRKSEAETYLEKAFKLDPKDPYLLKLQKKNQEGSDRE